MNGKQYRTRFIMLAGLFIGLFLLVVVQTTAAASGRWARWKIDTTFPTNTINTQLVIQVGHTNQAGQPIVDQQQSFAVTCTPVGNPIVQNGKATFNGSSYYSCAVPSIKEKVAVMTNGTMILPDSCQAKRPLLTGNLSVDGSPIDPTSKNSLFFRDDIQINIPLDVGLQQAQLQTAFAQGEALSASFPITAAGHVVTAVYDKTGPNSYAPLFTVDSLSLASTPLLLSGPFMLSNLASTVTIGYSPDTGDYFEGTLTSLMVDPVCVGQG